MTALRRRHRRGRRFSAEVLGIERNADRIRDRFRALARRAHPDAGGSDVEMARLVDARDRALAEIGGAA
jgi:curved DNA-binding protein CbpA